MNTKSAFIISLILFSHTFMSATQTRLKKMEEQETWRVTANVIENLKKSLEPDIAAMKKATAKAKLDALYATGKKS